MDYMNITLFCFVVFNFSFLFIELYFFYVKGDCGVVYVNLK